MSLKPHTYIYEKYSLLHQHNPEMGQGDGQYISGITFWKSQGEENINSASFNLNSQKESPLTSPQGSQLPNLRPMPWASTESSSFKGNEWMKKVANAFKGKEVGGWVILHVQESSDNDSQLYGNVL